MAYERQVGPFYILFDEANETLDEEEVEEDVGTPVCIFDMSLSLLWSSILIPILHRKLQLVHAITGPKSCTRWRGARLLQPKELKNSSKVSSFTISFTNSPSTSQGPGPATTNTSISTVKHFRRKEYKLHFSLLLFIFSFNLLCLLFSLF